MPMFASVVYAFFLLATLPALLAFPKRFTFELPDNDNLCFFDTLQGTKKYVLSYHVIHGGQGDVDIVIKDPNQNVISKVERGTDDDVVFNTANNGTYAFCFSNEFSSVSHKIIFFELRPEQFESLAEEAGLPQHATVMSLLESVIEVLHHFLSRAETLDIELKNRDYGDFLVAEELNSAVMTWSIIVTIVVIVTTVGQVTILKNFFHERKVAYSAYTPAT